MKKLQPYISPKNNNTYNDFAITGEFHKFKTEENEEFSFNLQKKETIKSNWEIILNKLHSQKNEFDIPDLVYLFLRRKAYETLMRMKVTGNRTIRDFNDIVDYVK